LSLPLRTRVVYGTGDWSMSSFNTLRQVFYAAFLTDVVGLDPRLASFSALAGVVWDAINDPVVGAISDRLRTRWGRRRPLMVAFALPFALAFVGLWWAPPWQSQWALAVHVALAYMISDTLQSLVTVPFLALTPELTTDYDERTSLTAWRMFFNLSASLAVAVAAPSIVDAMVGGGFTAQQGYLAVGALFGALGALPPLLVAATVRERPELLPIEPPTLGETLRGALANGPFRALVVLYLLNWVTFDLLGLMIPYFVTWWLGGGDPTVQMGLGPASLPVESAMLGALLVVSIPAVPLWSWLSQRLEKKNTYAMAMGLWLVVQLAVVLLPPGGYGWAVAVAALCGIGVAAAHVIPDAMLPDVIDEDELRTGRRNEGVYYGARNLFRKGAGALAVFLALQVLGWTGYAPVAPGENQPPAAILAVRLLTGPAGALLLAGAIGAALLYPLTRARHAEVLRQLEVRRGAP
jgi:glycoside/pentoside/hexuronide:cation symporter, GPH family